MEQRIREGQGDGREWQEKKRRTQRGYGEGAKMKGRERMGRGGRGGRRREERERKGGKGGEEARELRMGSVCVKGEKRQKRVGKSGDRVKGESYFTFVYILCNWQLFCFKNSIIFHCIYHPARAEGTGV